MPWQARQSEGKKGYTSQDMMRRKKRAIIQKAKLRRDYSQLLRKEGVKDIEASFKNKPCFAFMKGECTKGTECKFSHDPTIIAKARKSDPRKRKRKVEEQTKLSLEEQAKRKKEKEESLAKALKDRKKKTKLHRQRTKRGLPVFDNQIKLILEKLKKKSSEEQEENSRADKASDSDSDSDEDGEQMGPATYGESR